MNSDFTRIQQDALINKMHKRIGSENMPHMDSAMAGMPFRGEFVGKRLNEDANMEPSNRTDFDMLDNKPQHNTFLPAYGVSPAKFISTSSNNYTVNMMACAKTNALSSFSIYSIFASLFLSADSNTETESTLVDYFLFDDIDSVHKGLSQINNMLRKTKGIIIKNIILINNEHGLDGEMVKYLGEIATVRQISLNHVDNEFDTLNNYIGKITNNKIKKISKKILVNTNMICLSIIFINIMIPSFNIITNNSINLMGTINKEYDYHHEGTVKLVEIETNNKDIMLGIFMSNTTNEYPDLGLLPICISKLLKTMLAAIFIPFIDINNKTRLSTVLYQNGLSDMFEKMEISKLVQSTINLSDVLQHCLFHIVPPNAKPTNNVTIPNSHTSVIAKNTFFYYLRVKSTNTIILSGFY